MVKIRYYANVIYIIFLHYLAILLKHLKEFIEMTTGGWKRPFLHLILVYLAISIFFTAILPIDPLDLSNKTINISSDGGPLYHLMLDKDLLLNKDFNSLVGYYSNEDAFRILLSEPAIFTHALNQDILAASIMNETVLESISSEQNKFNITFSNSSMLERIFANESASSKFLNNTLICELVLSNNEIKSELKSKNITYRIDLPINSLFNELFPKKMLNLENRSSIVKWSAKSGSKYYLFFNNIFYSITESKDTLNASDSGDILGIFILPREKSAYFKNLSTEKANILKIDSLNGTIFIKILSEETASNDADQRMAAIDFIRNNSKIIMGHNISSNKFLVNSILKKAFDDIELKQIFYLEAIKVNDFRIKLIDDLSENESIKNKIIYMISHDDRLKDSALREIYSNNQTNIISFSLIRTNNKLTSILFRQNYKPWNCFIVILSYYWMQILAIWISIEIVLRLSRSRKNLEMVEFCDNTDAAANDPNKKIIAPGMASLLAVKLGKLGQLYSQVEEGRQISSVAITSNPVPAAIETKEMEDIASNIIADDSNLKVGFVSIPAKLINGLIDSMIKRPKLSGGLHKSSKDTETIILTASLSGWKRPLSWRVDANEKPLDIAEDSGYINPERKRTKDDMVTELACRIFTDLNFDEGQIVPWKATWYFTEGVRCYRDSLHGQSDRMIKLKSAINCFLNAQFQDGDFPWVHYNLGVVYGELNKSESSRQAFQRAILLNPGEWQPCYALALLNYQEHDDYDETISLCRKALNLRPDDLNRAKVYNLLGLTWKKKEKDRAKCHKHILENLAKGAIFSLYALMAEPRRKRQEEARSVVSKCLSDLAIIGMSIGIDNIIITKLMRIAIYHSPNDSHLHSILAGIEGNPEQALKELDRSSCPSSNEYWSDVAALCIRHCQKEKEEDRIERAIKCMLNDFSEVRKDELDKIIISIGQEGDYSEIRQLLIELYKIKCNNAPGKKKDVYPNVLQYWKAGKEILNRLWLEKDSLCMQSIREELRKKKSDEESLSEDLFRIQIRRDLDSRQPIESLRKTASDFKDSFHFWDIEKDIEKLMNIKPGKECDYGFHDMLREIQSALSSFRLEKIDSESMFREIEACSSAKAFRETLRICKELKYSHMMKDLGDIYFLCGYDTDPSGDQISAVKRIYNDIFNSIMKYSKDSISHEYEKFREDLRGRWDIKIEKSEFKRHQDLSIKYPLSALHHKNLGRSHYWLDNYKLARSEWEQALLLNPFDPRVRFNIGLTYIKEASDLKIDSDIRKTNYNQAQTYLKQALELCEDTRCILKTHLYLGILNYDNKYYDQAIAYFRIAQSMSIASGIREEETFIFKHELSCAYYYLKRYNQCERELIDLISKDDGNYSREVGRKLGNPIPIGRIMALARLNLAQSIMQRDADLDAADKWIDDARGVIDKAFPEKGNRKRAELDALWYDCRGYYLFKKKKHAIGDSSAANIREIKGSKALVKTAIISGIKSGAESSKIERANNMIILSNFKIENGEFEGLDCNKTTVRSGLIKRAAILGSTKIIYEEVVNNVVRTKENKGKHSAQICKYDSPIFNNNLYIESAQIKEAEINDFVIEDFDIEKTNLDRSIECLTKSISLAADPSSYLHLAMAYESKYSEEEDPKKRDVWKNLALSSLQLSEDTDINQENANELKELKERLGGKKEEASSPGANGQKAKPQ